MDPRTGEIYDIPNRSAREMLEAHYGELVPLTEQQAGELRPLSKRERKRLLAGYPCVCGSGKNFKKCCWKKYQKQGQ